MTEPRLVDGAAAIAGSAAYVADRSPQGLVFRTVVVEPTSAVTAATPATPEAEPAEQVGEPDAALDVAPARVKHLYTLPLLTPACLEPETWLLRWGEVLEVVGSAVPASLAADLAAALGLPAEAVRAESAVPPGCPRPLRPDRTALLAEHARASRELGAPIRLTVEAPRESSHAALSVEIDLGADDEGRLTAWSSVSRGASGLSLPWLFDVPHRRHRGAGGDVEAGEAEAGYLTSLALEDAAAALGLGPYEVALANLAVAGDQEKILRRLLEAADGILAMGRSWHPRGDAGKGTLRRGKGLAIGGGIRGERGFIVAMADAAVDWDTGGVEVRRLAGAATADPAVEQATARSLLEGGLVGGISRALSSGRLAAARMGDMGEIEVALVEGAVGGELPDGDLAALTTAAAIANAVANAIGVRVPEIPLTPERILKALARW
jgi:CO/xanthine dehydrogenase Mo-binding subunit